MRSGKFSWLAIGVLIALRPTLALAEDGSGIRASVNADIVGQAGLSRDSGATDTLRVREAELLFYAPADHLFDGGVNIAAHDEAGKLAMVELHEAYIGSTKLIPRTRFRVGQYFLGIGRLNQFHRHDWPFVSAPKVHREFFDAEGLVDSGIEASFLPKLPFFLEITGGLTNGYTYGHDHTAGNRPLVPTHYVRTATYLSLPWEGGMQIGFNYLGRRGNEGTQRTMLGIDLTAKWKEAKTDAFYLQSEVWFRSLTPSGSTTEKTVGAYVFPQYHFGDGWFFGMRFDYFSILNLEDAFGAPIQNDEIGFVPAVTYRPSEFSLFRLAYNNKTALQTAMATQTTHVVELQSVFFLGAHPAHDF